MAGSKKTSMTAPETRTDRDAGASRTDLEKVRAAAPYVWDGRDEDERPLTREEMQSGIEAYRKRRGRPAGSDKESTTIRFDREVLVAFRAADETNVIPAASGGRPASQARVLCGRTYRASPTDEMGAAEVKTGLRGWNEMRFLPGKLCLRRMS